MNNGELSIDDIARDILSNDDSQIDYYKNITNNMVGKVLRNHEIVEKNKDIFILNNFDNYSHEEIAELIALCDEKLSDYVEKRGEKIFQHRKKSSGYISGTLRYEIFKKAEFHCELCGISADKKALEVDHIVPRNNGGTDDTSNLQALCYSCNSMKRDRDDTDFRKIRESYKNKDKDCLFCNLEEKKIIHENNLACVIADEYPVTDSHSLIIPKRHVVDYFSLSRPEINACNELIEKMKIDIEDDDSSVKGFNIGINNGEVAGQTIFHCHIHLIPRREGDVDESRGGVRNLIPGKGSY